MKRLPSVVAVGLIGGPLIDLVLRALNIPVGSPSTSGDVGTATWLARTAWTGVAYAVPFYVCCAWPAPWVRHRLIATPSAVCFTGTTVAALAGGVPAFLMTGVLLGHWPRPVTVSWGAVLVGVVMMALVTAASVWRRRVAERALVAARARSKVLQAQINPHFFFNTLNTIAALIPEAPQAAQDTIARLADMSRYAFSSAERQRVPLADEIQFARAYLEIEHARFGDRLHFELPNAADMDGLDLPPLTVQPLVENAVRHGIAHRPDGGIVSVRVLRRGARFSVIVENDTEESVAVADTFFQPSHALTNIRDRLRLVYRGAASIDVSIPRLHVVTVTIQALTSPT
jgi:hypothetical protein